MTDQPSAVLDATDNIPPVSQQVVDLIAIHQYLWDLDDMWPSGLEPRSSICAHAVLRRLMEVVGADDPMERVVSHARAAIEHPDNADAFRRIRDLLAEHPGNADVSRREVLDDALATADILRELFPQGVTICPDGSAYAPPRPKEAKQ